MDWKTHKKLCRSVFSSNTKVDRGVAHNIVDQFDSVSRCIVLLLGKGNLLTKETLTNGKHFLVFFIEETPECNKFVDWTVFGSFDVDNDEQFDFVKSFHSFTNGMKINSLDFSDSEKGEELKRDLFDKMQAFKFSTTRFLVNEPSSGTLQQQVFSLIASNRSLIRDSKHKALKFNQIPTFWITTGSAKGNGVLFGMTTPYRELQNITK